MPTQKQIDEFVWAATELSNKENISLDEAGQRLAHLLVSDPVQDQIIEEARVLKAETVRLQERVDGLERGGNGGSGLAHAVDELTKRVEALEAVVVPT